MQSVVRSPRLWRLILGFICGPAVAAGLFAVIFPLYQGLPSAPERIWHTLVTVLWVVYPVTAIFGLPLYVILRSRARASMLNCVLSGAAVSALPWFILGLLATPNEASVGHVVTVHNHMRTLAGWTEFLQLIGGVAILGAIGGLVFWLCVATGPQPRLTATDPFA